jgi:hypothetical protein
MILTGFSESDSPGFGVFVELEALFVDDDLMVEPAECDQVFGIGFSALGPGGFVVDFDPIGGVASIDRTVSSGFG